MTTPTLTPAYSKQYCTSEARESQVSGADVDKNGSDWTDRREGETNVCVVTTAYI